MLWKDGGPTDEACQEAEALSSGRFDGACSARYRKVVDGFAVEVHRMPLEEVTGLLACPSCAQNPAAA